MYFLDPSKKKTKKNHKNYRKLTGKFYVNGKFAGN